MLIKQQIIDIAADYESGGRGFESCRARQSNQTISPTIDRATFPELAVGKACASCHGWTGVSAISPFATISGTRAVNDPSATNVAQIVISGTRRLTPDAMSMPSFGSIYTDKEIAAVANYVTGRFGSTSSKLTEKDVADLRRQTAR